MIRALVVALLALLIAGTAGGCSDGSEAVGDSGEIEILDAVTGAPPNPSVAAVRMVVVNGTGVDDELVGASSPVAEWVEIHRRDTDEEGRSVMTEVESLPVPASSTVTFEPDGLHVMLTGISSPLEPGDTYDLTISFAEAGDVTTTVEVVELADLVTDDVDHTHEEQP